MAYEKAMVYDLDGEFVGWTIIKDRDKLLLQTSHLWAEVDGQDVDEQIEKLNRLVALKPHWPLLTDHEVQALLQDPDWVPDDGQTRVSAAMHEIAIRRWSASAS